MARTNIDIVVTVRDGASAPLDKVQNKLKGTGKAAKDASADFVQFNKTLFTTGAFLGAFVGAFNKLKASVEVGADLDKATTQYEKYLGPRGVFIQSLQESSNIVVDETTAMQSALHLGMLGIVKDGSQAGTLISKFGVAAAMAGKDATKGVTDLTQAVENGDIAILQQYGMFKKFSAEYMAYTALMNKAGGTVGNMVVKQAQLALVTSVLNKHTKDQMFMMLSTGQVVEYFGKAFNNAKVQIGIFLGEAVRPLLEKLIPLLFKFKEFVYSAAKTNKEILFLGKTVLAFGTILTGLIATLGTLKLAVKLLGFAGVGLPGLLIATVALAAGFVGLTGKADGLVKKLEVLGAFFKGIYELVTNFDPETGMSKISAATEKMLADNGILGFVDLIAAVIVTVKAALNDLITFVTWGANKIDQLVTDIFGAANDGIKDSKKWTTWWTTDTLSNFDKVKRAALVLGGIIGAIFIGKKIFSGVAGLFGMGGESGKGPKGTESEPIWVKMKGMLGSAFNSATKLPFMDKIILAINNFILRSKILSEILTNPAGMLAGLRAVFASVATVFTGPLSGIFTAGAGVLGTAITAALSVGALLIAAKIGWELGTFLNKFVPESFSDPTRNRKKETFLEGKFNDTLEDWLDIGGGSKKKREDEESLERFFNTSNADLVKEFRTKQGGPKATTGGNALSSLSTSTSNDEQILQSVGEQMKTMKQADRDVMQNTLEKAFASPEANGRMISEEELSGIQSAFSAALAADANLTAMGEKAKAVEPIVPVKARK